MNSLVIWSFFFFYKAHIDENDMNVDQFREIDSDLGIQDITECPYLDDIKRAFKKSVGKSDEEFLRYIFFYSKDNSSLVLEDIDIKNWDVSKPSSLIEGEQSPTRAPFLKAA